MPRLPRQGAHVASNSGPCTSRLAHHMDSPRLSRMVHTYPRCMSTERKAHTSSSVDGRKRVPECGLKQMRLICGQPVSSKWPEQHLWPYCKRPPIRRVVSSGTRDAKAAPRRGTMCRPGASIFGGKLEGIALAEALALPRS